MSKISIELDLGVVQKALHAKVQPAVDKILADYDLSAMIVKELEKPETGTGDADYWGIAQLMYSRRWKDKEEPRIVHMVRDAINAAAKEYVGSHLSKDKAKIEAAFRAMLAKSSDKLAKTFVTTLDDALGNNWHFELNTTASVKEPERDYD